MNIPRKAFHAFRCASDDPTRRVLNHIEIRRDGDKHELCATDGKLLALVRWTDPESNGNFNRFSVSRETAQRIVKGREERPDVTAELVDREDNASAPDGTPRTFVLRPSVAEALEEVDPAYTFPDYTIATNELHDTTRELANVRLNPFRLKEACETLIKTAGLKKSEEPFVLFSLRRSGGHHQPENPRACNLPVYVSVKNDGVEAAVLIMPGVVD